MDGRVTTKRTSLQQTLAPLGIGLAAADVPRVAAEQAHALADSNFSNARAAENNQRSAAADAADAARREAIRDVG